MEIQVKDFSRVRRAILQNSASTHFSHYLYIAPYACIQKRLFLRDKWQFGDFRKGS